MIRIIYWLPPARPSLRTDPAIQAHALDPSICRPMLYPLTSHVNTVVKCESLQLCTCHQHQDNPPFLGLKKIKNPSQQKTRNEMVFWIFHCFGWEIQGNNNPFASVYILVSKTSCWEQLKPLYKNKRRRRPE